MTGRILVTGRSGQLARALAEAGAGEDLVVAGRGDGFDLADRRTIEQTLNRFAPRLVINTAAFTDVNGAETRRDEAFALNARGPGDLADACQTRGVALIHLSTDYVFGDDGDRWQTEETPTGPLNVYGETKRVGEWRVRAALPDAVIIRTSWILSPWGRNFLTTMLALGRDRETLEIVSDQMGSPTSASDLAGALLAIAGQMMETSGTGGVYHLVGRGVTSWYGLARHIFETAPEGLTGLPRLIPVLTRDYSTPALRPLNSRLNCAKAKAVFGVDLPSWEDGISRILARLCDEGTGK